ncbi:MAG: peptide deformylase [Clostridia bacterium]|nr:peptide deformylase [Clostridiales bacterium]MDU2293077.1 peptide deformylase [Peptococcus niger]MDU7244481.1 peptide deformylase [Clostridiales bacterium]MDU7505118.1 peptide deformylase [Clostridia bacterium]
MARYTIVTAGDPILRKTARPVDQVTDRTRKILNDMADTMYHAQGVGLAAPQVGISKRIIVVDVGDGLLQLVNPVISAKDGIQEGPEGCLSVPGLNGVVVRANHVVVTAQNEYGEPVTIDAEGFKARALQHEIDHLEGILYTDKASSVERVD